MKRCPIVSPSGGDYITIATLLKGTAHMSMKQICYSVTGLVAASLMLVGVVAISNAQGPNQRMDRMGHSGEHNLRASELIGLSVHTANNEDKGKIKDLLISPNGQIEYVAVSFGGFLGMGDKFFAVPLDALQIEWKDNKPDYARCDITEETIKQRQGFDNGHWPEQADRSFMMNHPGHALDHTSPNR